MWSPCNCNRRFILFICAKLDWFWTHWIDFWIDWLMVIHSVHRGDLFRVVENGWDSLVVLLIAVICWWILLVSVIPAVFGAWFCDKKSRAFASVVYWRRFTRSLLLCLPKTEGIVPLAVLYGAAIVLIHFMTCGYIYAQFLCVKPYNNWTDFISISWIICAVLPCEIIDIHLMSLCCIDVGMEQSVFCQEIDVVYVPPCETSNAIWMSFLTVFSIVLSNVLFTWTEIMFFHVRWVKRTPNIHGIKFICCFLNGFIGIHAISLEFSKTFHLCKFVCSILCGVHGWVFVDSQISN